MPTEDCRSEEDAQLNLGDVSDPPLLLLLTNLQGFQRRSVPSQLPVRDKSLALAASRIYIPA